jgi:hypothetical protein
MALNGLALLLRPQSKLRQKAPKLSLPLEHLRFQQPLELLIFLLSVVAAVEATIVIVLQVALDLVVEEAVDTPQLKKLMQLLQVKHSQ